MTWSRITISARAAMPFSRPTSFERLARNFESFRKPRTGFPILFHYASLNRNEGRHEGAQTKQEVMTHAARRPSAAFRFAGRADQRGLRRMEREALREDRIITSFDQCDETRGQRHALFAGEVRPMAGTAQQTLHLARPVFALDRDQRLEFTQVMRVA